jgi:hypothetical protein
LRRNVIRFPPPAPAALNQAPEPLWRPPGAENLDSSLGEIVR